MELFVFAPAFGELSGSPFVTKSIAMLNAADQPYKLTRLDNPSKMPKQKLPVLKVGDRMIPDSEQIREYIETEFNIDFNAGLSPKDRAISYAISRMVEEHTYFIVYASRWMEDKHWAVLYDMYFKQLPWPIRRFIARMVRKGAVAQIKAQGMGRHSKAERLTRFSNDLDAIETQLADQKYLFGDKPTTADYSVVTALSGVQNFPVENDLSIDMKNRTQLLAYLAHGKAAMFPS